MMSAEAATTSGQTQGMPQRRFRNYLLDPRFQMKYVGMVVAVTLVVASVFGAFVYDFSKGLTESLVLNQSLREEYQDETAFNKLQEDAAAADRRVLAGIIVGIALLSVALGFTGIVVTHKVVGPAYKLRRLMDEVAGGKLHLAGRLRKGDELQEIFESFEGLVEALRAERARDIEALEAAAAEARESGASDAAVAKIVSVSQRLRETLD
jgi:nitrogen fixation/metabolism regulation signal transduction histidine kinase